MVLIGDLFSNYLRSNAGLFSLQYYENLYSQILILELLFYFQSNFNIAFAF